MVMVGAEGVVENGGIINKLGTYQIAICARAHNVPVYVAAESYKVPPLPAPYPCRAFVIPAAGSCKAQLFCGTHSEVFGLLRKYSRKYRADEIGPDAIDVMSERTQVLMRS